MHVRLTRIEGTSAEIEAGAKSFEGDVAEPARKVPGFAGIVLLVNPEEGKAIGVSYWADEAALKAGAEAMKRVREHATSAVGTRITSVDTGEVLSMERTGTPEPNNFIRLVTALGKPEKTQAGLAAYLKDALPVLKSSKGFRAATMSANRESGTTWVSSVWETAEDRQASGARLSDVRRETAAAGGAGEVVVETFRSAHVEFAVGAVAATA
jgi:heme-degrading monooxygenase HmoA